jgi:hypothetical protein
VSWHFVSPIPNLFSCAGLCFLCVADVCLLSLIDNDSF